MFGITFRKEKEEERWLRKALDAIISVGYRVNSIRATQFALLHVIYRLNKQPKKK